MLLGSLLSPLRKYTPAIGSPCYFGGLSVHRQLTQAVRPHPCSFEAVQGSSLADIGCVAAAVAFSFE
jgi:hypothetical protein